ncbi:50S ribosomal protein L6 [bacterium]|nr:50S ribosomal protein L6 [bacterium]
MSRIGKKPIVIPENTTVEVENNVVTVKGKNGTLTQKFRDDVVIEVKNNEVHVTLPEKPTNFSEVYHGTARALINNMVVGCSEGFKVPLEIKGTGYRFVLNNPQVLTVIAGYSNPVESKIPEGITIELPTQTDCVIKGANKEQVGEYAANIRGIRPPEPYHGKGIRYKGEKVRHKEGKTAK